MVGIEWLSRFQAISVRQLRQGQKQQMKVVRTHYVLDGGHEQVHTVKFLRGSGTWPFIPLPRAGRKEVAALECLRRCYQEAFLSPCGDRKPVRVNSYYD